MLAAPSTAPLLTRERVSPLYFFSYTFIPLSSIAFPHIGIFCLTARRLEHFRRTVVLYPICMLAIWLPSVFLGLVANKAVDLPAIRAKVEARAMLAAQGPALPPERRQSLYRKFADNHTWHTPTLVVSRAVMLTGDSAARAIFGKLASRDERRPYASRRLLEWWRMQVGERIGRLWGRPRPPARCRNTQSLRAIA